MADLPAEVKAMIDAASALGTDQWRVVLDTSTGLPGYREAAQAALPGAAVDRQVEKAVLQALRPRASVITAIRSGAFSTADFSVQRAAHSMMKKDLDEAQRELLTRPLRAAGLADELFAPVA